MSIVRHLHERKNNDGSLNRTRRQHSTQLVQTIDATKGDASVAGFTFKTVTRWKDGATSTTEISSFTRAGQEQTQSRSHVLTGSEPEWLLGQDSVPKAVGAELLYAPTDPGQDDRSVGTLELLWNLFDFTPEATADHWVKQLSYS